MWKQIKCEKCVFIQYIYRQENFHISFLIPCKVWADLMNKKQWQIWDFPHLHNIW